MDCRRCGLDITAISDDPCYHQHYASWKALVAFIRAGSDAVKAADATLVYVHIDGCGLWFMSGVDGNTYSECGSAVDASDIWSTCLCNGMFDGLKALGQCFKAWAASNPPCLMSL